MPRRLIRIQLPKTQHRTSASLASSHSSHVSRSNASNPASSSPATHPTVPGRSPLVTQFLEELLGDLIPIYTGPVPFAVYDQEATACGRFTAIQEVGETYQIAGQQAGNIEAAEGTMASPSLDSALTRLKSTIQPRDHHNGPIKPNMQSSRFSKLANQRRVRSRHLDPEKPSVANHNTYTNSSSSSAIKSLDTSTPVPTFIGTYTVIQNTLDDPGLSQGPVMTSYIQDQRAGSSDWPIGSRGSTVLTDEQAEQSPVARVPTIVSYGSLCPNIPSPISARRRKRSSTTIGVITIDDDDDPPDSKEIKLDLDNIMDTLPETESKLETIHEVKLFTSKSTDLEQSTGNIFDILTVKNNRNLSEKLLTK